MYQHFTKLAVAGLSLVLGLAAVLLSSAALANDIVRTMVNCNAPRQSLADALSSISLDAVNEIHFRGTCIEDLTITKDDVTLTGDGVPNAVIMGGINIDGAHRVSLRDFDLTSPGAGDTGVDVSNGAAIKIDNIVISSGNIGIFVSNGSFARIENADVTVTGDEAALVVANGSTARLAGGSTLRATGEDVLGIDVKDHASLHQGGGSDEIIGGILINTHSYARMRNVDIAGDISITRISELRLRDDDWVPSGTPTVTGAVGIDRGSFARLDGGEISVGVFCRRGSNAQVSSDVVISSGVNTCTDF